MTRPRRQIRPTPPRRTRYLGLMAAAVVALGAAASLTQARADTIVDFVVVPGTAAINYGAGSVLDAQLGTSTMSVDTTTGLVTSEYFSFGTGPGFNFTTGYSTVGYFGQRYATGVTDLIAQSSNTSRMDFNLALNTGDLTAYAGQDLTLNQGVIGYCPSYPGNCYNEAGSYNFNNAFNTADSYQITGLTFTPTDYVGAPAPILGTGLSGLAVLAVFLFARRAKLRFHQA